MVRSTAPTQGNCTVYIHVQGRVCVFSYRVRGRPLDHMEPTRTRTVNCVSAQFGGKYVPGPGRGARVLLPPARPPPPRRQPAARPSSLPTRLPRAHGTHSILHTRLSNTLASSMYPPNASLWSTSVITARRLKVARARSQCHSASGGLDPDLRRHHQIASAHSGTLGCAPPAS